MFCQTLSFFARALRSQTQGTLFNLFCIGMDIFSVSVAGFYVPFTYLPKAAIEKGITRENAAFLLSIIGTITPILRACSHQTNVKTKKIEEQAEEIKEKTSNKNFRFCYRHRLVCMGFTV